MHDPVTTQPKSSHVPVLSKKGNFSLPEHRSRALKKSLPQSFSFPKGLGTLIHYQKQSHNIITVIKTLKSQETETGQFSVKTEKVGSALRNPELTLNKDPKQLPKLVFQNGTQFGTQDNPNMNMQPKKPKFYDKNQQQWQQLFTRIYQK